MAANPRLFNFIGIEPMSEFGLAKVTEEGLPLESVSALKNRGLTYTEISETVISPRTLKHRKARNEPLSHEETDRVVRVARIVSLAEEVFASREKALLWMRTPDDRLENRTPLKMLITESGGRLIENLLWQIDEGVYA